MQYVPILWSIFMNNLEIISIGVGCVLLLCAGRWWDAISRRKRFISARMVPPDKRFKAVKTRDLYLRSVPGAWSRTNHHQVCLRTADECRIGLMVPGYPGNNAARIP